MRCALLTSLAIASLLITSAMAGEEAPDPRRIDTSIEGGLRWLAKHQIVEGDEAGRWECTREYYAPATASLAGLAFLANGHFPGQGKHGEVVDRALAYVMASMDPEGYLGRGDPSGMYIHAISTLFGLSCLGTLETPEREEALAVWCQKAINVILEAQQVRRAKHARGGWRYTPQTSEADVSVTSWQLLVLHAARQSGYAIDDAVFEDAVRYINRAFVRQQWKTNEQGEVVRWRRNLDGEYVEDPEGERVEETPPGYAYRTSASNLPDPEPAATGVALFIKTLLDGELDENAGQALTFLQRFPPAWDGPQYGGYFYFASFYMTQGMFQIGGERWQRYAGRMQTILIRHQAGDGHWPFPANNTPQSRLAGRAYPTAMAILVLSLEKQYLPMYQRQRRLF